MRHRPALDYESVRPSPRRHRLKSRRVALVLLFCMPVLAALLVGCVYLAVGLLERVWFGE